LRFGLSVLVVDLDGTLLKSDMLHESFWSAIGLDWRTPFSSALKLLQGRATLKEFLSEKSQIDISLLPFDNDVIEFIKSHRKQGGRVALVTATHISLAKRIAKHLKIFDEVYGSDGKNNLKGKAKADFLSEHFGQGSFDYMGNSAADLPVWEKARNIITVNAPRSVRDKAGLLDKPCQNLVTWNPPSSHYLKTLRPHQWLKNILVFVPMFAAHQFDTATLSASLIAFVAFSLIASGIYVLNDLLDLDADRAHPRKKYRPFASGIIPIQHGGILILIMMGLGTFLALLLGAAFVTTMVIYIVANLTYSMKLKRMIAVDILFLAGLYTIRMIAGGFATSIDLSLWLIVFSLFLFFSLASTKRQAELVDLAKRKLLKAKGRGYDTGHLPIISAVGLGTGYASVFVLAFYVNSSDVIKLYGFPQALLGVCGVLFFWITRTALITRQGNMNDDPVLFAAKDGISQLCLLAVICFTMLGALL
jgi:4-hydroxybenzoate polyprenyltransferase/phosphoserine phosphatase